MNIKQFRKDIGKWVRLRSCVERRTSDLQHLPRLDDYWCVERVNDTSTELKNIRTGHVVKLGFDNIHKFRSPNFLLLRCQIIMRRIKIISEPVITRS
jgi:hypothetical protein